MTTVCGYQVTIVSSILLHRLTPDINSGSQPTRAWARKSKSKTSSTIMKRPGIKGIYKDGRTKRIETYWMI